MNLNPIGNRVIIRPMQESETTSSGIILPNASKERPSRGEVIAIGNTVTDIAVGNVVLFGKYAGSEVKFNEQEYLLLDAADVFCTIEE